MMRKLQGVVKTVCIQVIGLVFVIIGSPMRLHAVTLQLHAVHKNGALWVTRTNFISYKCNLCGNMKKVRSTWDDLCSELLCSSKFTSVCLCQERAESTNFLFQEARNIKFTVPGTLTINLIKVEMLSCFRFLQEQQAQQTIARLLYIMGAQCWSWQNTVFWLWFMEWAWIRGSKWARHDDCRSC